MTKPSILVVDDDQIILNSLCEFLTIEGYNAVGSGSFTDARQALKQQSFGIMLSDVNLSDGDGFELLKFVKEHYPRTAVILITGYGTIESAVEAIKKGACDYLTKPIKDDDLLMSVERAARQRIHVNEKQSPTAQPENKYNLGSFISKDEKMSKIFDLVEAVADSRTTILMSGASGTGKSLLARTIHYRSPRARKPFVEVSCGALPETLLESELFGHVKGAFTGAVSDKEGKFLAANGGTLFLDEIASASPAMQTKLLRVLQERQFEPVGSNKTVRVDTRVLLASNRNLEDEVRAGRFREDLFYRVNVVTIHLPSLAERPEDIPLLADHFLKYFSQMHNRDKTAISQEAVNCLQQYSWPGNVRQLENILERAVLLSKGPVIEIGDLTPAIVQSFKTADTTKTGRQTLKRSLEVPERAIIRASLEANHWNRQQTAKSLDINRTTLYKKMKRYGLEDEARRLGY